ncbi:hypothetical protein MUK42_02456 [Musa troglodytarum]|uniref:RNA helicase n=1 Tax=Musa troglodytarum TaxID=320322 RepID=A0A9E7JFB1_9LILI|nr:hypothetical protein MUK42_02456 [Musa troglodytarum]
MTSLLAGNRAQSVSARPKNLSLSNVLAYGEHMARFWRPGSERPRATLVDDEEGGVLFVSAPPSSSSSGFGHSSLERQRQRLPVFKYRDAILYLVENHATTIIVGETGSGKTTQIPQYLKEAGWAEGGRVVACTQPRRLAVQSVASRVAEEMGVKIGEEVGYTIRFEDQTNPSVTVIKFLTDGVLIREMMDDPLLTKYSVIMVDEAHERSLSTDMLLGLLKKIQRRRPELRIIISSATIEAKSMSTFFQARKKDLLHAAEDCVPSHLPAILSVEGKGYTVEIHYVEEPVPDYLQAAVHTVLSINDKEPAGDILVFLTGQDDIDAAVKLLREDTQDDRRRTSGLLVLPLYSGLSRDDQGLVFAPTPKGKRKVVISTNIAETSLTLEGVVYVVDSGFSKQRFYNPMAIEEDGFGERGGRRRGKEEEKEEKRRNHTYSQQHTMGDGEISDIESLVVTPISKASARQRAGRAGRIRPGKCFRLYTEEYFLKEMPTEGIPEMQRSNLVSCVIQLKALGIDNILGFDWLASPPPEAMVRALEVLYSLGILDEDAKLTSPIGYQVAEIPLDPMISKMILSACNFGCSEEIITIAAVLSVQSIWVSMWGAQKEFDEVKLHFAAAEILRKAIIAGFFANSCHLEEYSHNGLYKTVRSSEEVYIHPSSVLFRVNPKWVVYHSLVSTNKHYMRNVIAIDPSWLIEAAPHFYQLRAPNLAPC